jgi:hypothetical protein
MFDCFFYDCIIINMTYLYPEEKLIRKSEKICVFQIVIWYYVIEILQFNVALIIFQKISGNVIVNPYVCHLWVQFGNFPTGLVYMISRMS